MSKELNAIKIGIEKGYKVDELGRVISPRGQFLKLHPNTSGYLSFTIFCDGRNQSIRVHKFVGFVKFGDEIFSGFNCLIRHLDGNKLNNSFSNIEKGTASQNRMDIPKEVRAALLRRAQLSRSTSEKSDCFKRLWETRRAEFKQKLSYSAKNRKTTVCGESHGSSKLTWMQVHEIRNNYDGLNNSQVAKFYSVDTTTIRRIRNYTLWNKSPNEETGGTDGGIEGCG